MGKNSNRLTLKVKQRRSQRKKKAREDAKLAGKQKANSGKVAAAS